MARSLVSGSSRRELWWWRGTAVLSLAACAALLSRQGAALHGEPTEPDAQVHEQATGTHARRNQESARHGSSPRLALALAALARARSSNARCMAVDQLSRVPDVDAGAVAQIAQFTETSHPLELRRCSTAALGNIGHEAAFEPLRALADDEVAMIAEAALTALAMRPDRASHEAAIELSKDRPRNVQVSVACALAQSGAMEATPLIARLLEGGPWHERERLVMALGQTGDPRAIGLLQKVISSGNRNALHSAIYALGEIGGPAATETLLHLLDERPELAAAAASALARSGSEQAREALLAMVEKSPGFGAGLSALQALSELDGPGVRELMQGMLDQPQNGVRSIAIEYFANHGDVEALPMLERLAREGNMHYSQQALHAMSRIGGEQVSSTLEELAQGSGPLAPMALNLLSMNGDTVRAKSIVLAQLQRNPNHAGGIELLMNDDSPEAIAALSKAAAQGGPGIASQAMMTLAQRGDAESKQLIEKLAGPGNDPQRRSAALWAVAQSGGPSAVKTLRAALEDKDPSVRAQSVNALSQLGGPEAESALLAASRDASTEVVGAATSGLVQIGTPAAMTRLEEIARVPETAAPALMALVNSAPSRALSIAETMIGGANADARRAALMVASQMPGEGGSRILLGALRTQDPDLVRQAIETANMSGALSDEVRAAMRSLDKSELPEDVKQLAANVAEGGGGMMGGFGVERAMAMGHHRY